MFSSISKTQFGSFLKELESLNQEQQTKTTIMLTDIQDRHLRTVGASVELLSEVCAIFYII